MKLVLEEPETSALRSALQGVGRLTTSAVGITEVLRAAGRIGIPSLARRAVSLIGDVDVVELTGSIQRRAGEISPNSLRSMDAIHVASALSIGPVTRDFYCYDRRLCEAAAAAGLNVLSPGR